MRFGSSILSAGLIICVCCLTAVGATAQEANIVSAPAVEPNGPPPKIFFEQTTLELGYVSPGSTNDCEFKFQNKGQGKLIISEITKTCGCTPFTLEKNDYAPGESGIIKIQYHADTGNGVRTRHLFVLSNDSANPKVDLTIKATIVQKVTAEPERLEYTLKGPKAGVAELTIKSVDDKPFKISKFESTSDAVTANIAPDQNAAKFVLQTKIDSQKMGSSLTGRIDIALTHPDCKTITIPFNVLSRFRAVTPAINGINAEKGKMIKKVLWILENYEQDFEIDSVTSKAGIIKVAHQEKMGNRYKIDLEIMPPSASQGTARMFTDTLSISMKDGDKIDVICRGFFLKR